MKAKKANIGAEVLRVDECGLVTQADIARKIGHRRQLVHQYISGARGPGGFPPPAGLGADGPPMWSWCEVAAWLGKSKMVTEEVVQEAREATVINSVLELQRQFPLAPALMNEVLRAVR